MTACVNDILDLVNGFAPFDLAEKWDNSGLQAGDPSWPVKKIMVCLDVTMAVMAAAKADGCDLVLSHHPLVMSPEKTMDFSRMPGSAIALSARENMAIVSAHTNLDKAQNGLNDYFADMLGIDCTGPFYTENSGDDPAIGIGRLGTVATPLTVAELTGQVKQALGIEAVRVAGQLDLKIREVALCTGSGGSLTSHFLKSQAQVYITGDLKYHEARDIEAAGRAALDVGHFASEHIVIGLLKKCLAPGLADLGGDVTIIEYKNEEDPFKII